MAVGVRALAWTLSAVVLIVAGCGPTQEDRNRLATISTDPLLQVEPDAFEDRVSLKRLATAESPAFGDATTISGLSYDLPATNDLASLFTPYLEHLMQQGWSDISARCRDNDFSLSAKRTQDSYVVRAQVRALSSPPDEGAQPQSSLSVAVIAPHSGSDGFVIADAPPELDCLASG